jgi:hypothetical protein
MTRYDILLKRFKPEKTDLEKRAEAARNRVPKNGWEVFDENKRREDRADSWTGWKENLDKNDLLRQGRRLGLDTRENELWSDYAQRIRAVRAQIIRGERPDLSGVLYTSSSMYADTTMDRARVEAELDSFRRQAEAEGLFTTRINSQLFPQP